MGKAFIRSRKPIQVRQSAGSPRVGVRAELIPDPGELMNTLIGSRRRSHKGVIGSRVPMQVRPRGHSLSMRCHRPVSPYGENRRVGVVAVPIPGWSQLIKTLIASQRRCDMGVIRYRAPMLVPLIGSRHRWCKVITRSLPRPRIQIYAGASEHSLHAGAPISATERRHGTDPRGHRAEARPSGRSPSHL